MTTPRLQLVVGLGVMALAVGLGVGASVIPSTAGYAGVGPNFLPWVVSVVLLICGGMLAWHATHGGYRDVEPPSGAERGDWTSMAWVSAGALAIAALITTIGFVFACGLGYVLAVRGLRSSEGKPAGDLKTTVVDVLVGLAISAPVFWLFRRLLGLTLPGLSESGWI